MLLGLTFTYKVSDYTFLLISCYLPPDKSFWGQDATGFFSHILSIMYRFCDVHAIYIMGYMNSCIGNKMDIDVTVLD